jgi:peptidoglycan hydrolase-like protein with peptidoglycan-binding domain
MKILARLILCFALVGLATASQGADPTVLAAQKILKQRGYYRGTVDGLIGSRTAAAIRRYQVAENLRVTGQLTPQTLRSLGLPMSSPAPK